MKITKYHILIIFALIICIAVVFCLFKPRPIVDDINNIREIQVFYNPYYDQDVAEQRDYDADADRVLVADYDEKLMLECLSRYKEYRTLNLNQGYWMGDVQLEFVIMKDKGPTTCILLGSVNYSYHPNGKFKFKIQGADKLKAELLDLIDIQKIYDNV